MNKPYLPLASGELSVQTGWMIVLTSGVVSLLVGMLSDSWPLMSTLVGSLVLGIAYSTDLPFLRWKRHPAIAAACILSVRAILVQLGFYFHMKLSMGAPGTVMQGPIIFATAFMFIFSIVIALFKDIPDAKGDKMSGVETLTVRIGRPTVYWICIGLLEAAYVSSIFFSLIVRGGIMGLVSAALHASIGALLLWRAYQTDLESSSSVYDCYMDVWKAFYLEYLFLPLLSQ